MISEKGYQPFSCFKNKLWCHRRYDNNLLLGVKNNGELTLGYARVSSHDQKEDLKRQVEVLELYGANNGWQCQIIQDLGSGLNYNRPLAKP